MPPSPNPYLPDLADLGALLAVAGAALAIVAIGALAGGRKRLAEADLLCGWGVVIALITIVGTATRIPLSALTHPVIAIAAVGAFWVIRRDGRLTARGAVRVALLGAPLLIIVAPMTASQWDEFSQWLYSAKYLVAVDAFPRPDLVQNPASYPGYPYGLPMIMFVVARLAGGFVENAGIVFNVFVLLSFALLLARLIADGAAGRLDSGPDAAPGFGLCALGLLVAVVVPPFIVPKIAFTTYAEVGTAAALAFAAVLGWQALEASADGDRTRARTRAWQSALALIVLVSLKQANLVLLIILAGGFLIAGLRRPDLSITRVAGLVAAIAVPSVIVYLFWRYHVQLHLPGREFTIREFSQWNVALLPETLSTMLGIALRKSGYFALMIVIAGFSLRSLFKHHGPFDTLLIISGAVFVGYNAFLVFAYVAAFGEGEARHAASYWRYNMHLGLLAAATASYGGALMWRRHRAARPAFWAGWLAVVVVLAAPVALVNKVRFDLHPPKQYVRVVGAELVRILPADARLAVFDPGDVGFYAKLVRYLLHPDVAMVFEHHIFANRRDLPEKFVKSRSTHAWVHTQSDEVRALLGAEMPSGASYLLEKTDDGWRAVTSWPYPGYDLPTDIPD
jgi:hypothetical protein